ncbi:MAG TPA: DUF2490 domain-containing protein [Sphingomonas sp.]|jgi:hypothetical protein|nr:DUF2490 domain-containing protein [Sphingomonas sp.]
MISRRHRARLGWLSLGSALSLVAAPAAAQQEDEQLWFQINTNVPVADRVRLTLEQIARFSDRQDGLYQTEFGGLLSYRAVEGVELGFGYRKVGAHNGNTGADEDRLRQQVVATFGLFTTRFRVDERFNPRGSEIGFRVRPLIRYNYPLRKKGVALFVSHESFLIPNTTSWGQRSGYERMRNIAGFVLPMGRAAADVGYLNQYRLGRGGARAQMDHALTVQLTINTAALTAPSTHD